MTAHTGSGHRERLVDAMADLLAERGYSSVTVAEIVARARVSKRTFYEQFAEREDCFLATYVALAEQPLARITAAASDPEIADGALTEQVGRAGAPTSRRWRSGRPSPAHCSPRSRPSGRAGVRYAARSSTASPPSSSPSPTRRVRCTRAWRCRLALGLVGGINELVLDAVDSVAAPEAADRGTATGELGRSVTDLVVAVLLRRPSDPS